MCQTTKAPLETEPEEGNAEEFRKVVSCHWQIASSWQRFAYFPLMTRAPVGLSRSGQRFPILNRVLTGFL